MKYLIYSCLLVISFLPIHLLQAQDHMCCSIEGFHEPPEATMEIYTVLPFQTEPTYVTVDVHGGEAIYQGDIVLGNIKQLLEEQEQLKRGIIITGSGFRWPNGVIPYEIESGFASGDLQEIVDAISTINSSTNIIMVERTVEDNYVNFRTGSGCSSPVGMQGGKQNITLTANCSEWNTVHEILHAAGIWHEQSRSDRDTYLTVHPDSIESGKDHNFDMHDTDGTNIGPYDFESIMHYNLFAFGIDNANGQTSHTMTVNAGITVPAGVTIGQRNHLSPGDINTVAFMYNDCPGARWVHDKISSTVIYTASNHILSTGTLANGNWTVYRAPNVTLHDGFEVKLGGDFYTSLNACVGNPVKPQGGFTKGQEAQPQVELDDEITSDDFIRHYPNPFTEMSVIEYHMETDGEVSIEVFNVMGQPVAQPDLGSDYNRAGTHIWQFDARSLAPGTYYCKVKTATQEKQLKLLLIR